MSGRVVLFFPSYYSDEAAPPLALIHLAAPLVERGYDVRIVDSAVSPDCVAEVVSACEGAICLGISMVTGPMITQGVEVARAVKARWPDLPIVAGGWHASILPEQTLRSPFIDAVVKGQGEVTFLEMVERYARGERDLTGIAGSLHKQDGAWSGTATAATRTSTRCPGGRSTWWTSRRTRASARACAGSSTARRTAAPGTARTARTRRSTAATGSRSRRRPPSRRWATWSSATASTSWTSSTTTTSCGATARSRSPKAC